MKKSDVNEILAQLYFRLNGYFTTGLILHSPEWGQARTEIDCLAIRHRYHCQPERRVEGSDFLGVHNGETDIILCEVKSDKNSLRFNQPIKNDIEALRATLRWTGIFTEANVCSVADRLMPLLQDDTHLDAMRTGVIEESIRVRPLLCCPSCSEAAIDKWCLLGSDIFDFANQCFNPEERRDTCSTRYNFQQWGYPFSSVVTYFKNRCEAETINIDELYQHIGAE
jgi:hypothetical protein